MWAHSNSFIVSHEKHTRSCTLTYMWCSKGHTFSTGQWDNASDFDKQLVVKVAGYKSGAGREGLLSTGDWELLSSGSVTGKVNKSFGAMCVWPTYCLIMVCVTCCVYLGIRGRNVHCPVVYVLRRSRWFMATHFRHYRSVFTNPIRSVNPGCWCSSSTCFYVVTLCCTLLVFFWLFVENHSSQHPDVRVCLFK